LSVDPKSEVGKIIRRLKRLKDGYHKDFYRKWAKLRKELYKTGAYQIFLREVRIRAMYRCQRCPKPGRHVHHIIRVYDNPDLVVDPNNAMYLCVACHRKEHAAEKKGAA
jgi:5-methylcytosine-specific restriction endonuclease McrA